MSLENSNRSALYKIAAIILLILGFSFQIIPAFFPLTEFIQHIPDDAFYLYKISDNLAIGRGLSFDGIKPTTSARPLYILMLVGLRQLIARGYLPMLAFIFGVLANVITALLILRFSKRLQFPSLIALITMTLYLFSSRAFAFTDNGMETPFAVLTLAIIINLYPREGERLKTRVALATGRGIMTALMMMLRLDYCFFAVPIILWEIVRSFKRRNWDFLWAGFAVAIWMLPWVWWSFTERGGLMPPSGDALAMVLWHKPRVDIAGLVLRYKYLVDSFTACFPLLKPFPVNAFWMGLQYLLLFWCLFILFLSRKPLFSLQKRLWITCLVALAMVGLTWFLLTGIYYLWYLLYCFPQLILFVVIFGRGRYFRSIIFKLVPLWVGVIALAFYFSEVRFFWREWNLVMGDLIFYLILGAALADMWGMGRRKASVIFLSCWVMAVNINDLVGGTWPIGISNPMPKMYYELACWLKSNTSPDTVIASANGGVLVWFCERELVDTAGIEDIDSYDALKGSRLFDYMKLRRVKYLVDMPQWVFHYYKDYWGVDIKTKIEIYYDPFSQELPKNLDYPVIYKLL